jgi:hypothetical protein
MRIGVAHFNAPWRAEANRGARRNLLNSHLNRHNRRRTAMQHFSDLLAAAHAEPEPQRLLLVFAAAELPRDATPAERAQFERGEGGALAPVICVDKRPEEIADFAALCAEAGHTAQHWDILFVAAMSGRGGHAPSNDEAVQPLRMMVEQIGAGHIARFLAVDRNGDLVQLQAR